jgi:hypothetical protein
MAFFLLPCITPLISIFIGRTRRNHYLHPGIPLRHWSFCRIFFMID